LNAAKFVVFVFEAATRPVSLAPSALLVSTAGAGVGNAALESRRDRRAVADAVGVRTGESDGRRYFVADIVDVDVDDGGGGDIVFGVATVVELVFVVCLWDTLERERGERGIDLVGGTWDLPRAVNLLALFGKVLDPLGEGEEGRSTLLRRE
jgi:hypothetical protein